MNHSNNKRPHGESVYATLRQEVLTALKYSRFSPAEYESIVRMEANVYEIDSVLKGEFDSVVAQAIYDTYVDLDGNSEVFAVHLRKIASEASSFDERCSVPAGEVTIEPNLSPLDSVRHQSRAISKS
jgi:hypothetical protein